MHFQWPGVHDVALLRFEDQHKEDVYPRNLIPLKCVGLQIDPGAAWFQESKSVMQASKLLTPACEREILTAVPRY